MAFPTFRSEVSTPFASTVTAWTTNLPATVNAGDLLLVYLSVDGGDDSTVTWDNSSHGTWTQVYDVDNLGAIKGVCWEKIADGTEDSGTLSITLDVGKRGFAYSVSIANPGARTTSTPDIGNSDSPDPPSVTGSAAGDNLFIVFHHGDSVDTASAYPTNYNDNQASETAGGGTGATYSVASRGLASATDDPGVFTLISSDQWIASTTIVEEASIGPVLSLPTETSITQTTVTVGATTDDATGTLYYYISTSATAPSISDLKDGTGSTKFGNDASLSVGANTFAVTGLIAGTTYYTYFIQNDGSNDSNLLESGSWVTLTAPVLSITSITDPAITATALTITGTVFESSQGTGGVTQTISGNTVALTETAWADTEITATSATIESTQLKYGVQTIEVTNDSAGSDTDTYTATPLSGNDFVDLTSVATVGQIITVATLAIGDQLRYEDVTTPGSFEVIVLADGTFTIDGSATDGVYTFEVRAWDTSDQTWGTAADQSVTIGSTGAPAQFTFTDVTNANLSSGFTDTQALTGGTLVDGVTTLTVTNGLTSVTGSGGTFDSTAKTYSAGDSFVRATVTSSGSYSTAVTQTPSVNGVSDEFSVTTKIDAVPAQFTFTDVTDAALSTPFTDTQALTGGTLVDGVSDLTVTNGLTSVTGSGGTFDGSTKIFSAGDSFVRASVTSSSSHSTAVTQTPDVNGISDTFSVTTLAAVAPIMPANTTNNVTEPGQTFGTFAASNTPSPAAVYTITGTDSGVLGINSSTGAVTADSPTDESVKDTYTYTVTATNSEGNDSQNIVTTIVIARAGIIRDIVRDMTKDIRRDIVH